MDNPNAVLEQASALLAQLAEAQYDAFDDDTLCALAGAAEQVGRRLDTVRALSAAEIDSRSRYGLGPEALARKHGLTRGLYLLERITRVSQAEAARRIRVGAAISPRHTLDGHALEPDFPVVAAAMRAGTMPMDAAATVTRILEQTRRRADQSQLDEAEKDLVHRAAHESSDLVAVRARVWREFIDADGAKPRDNELRERRAFRLGREKNGMTPFSGAADPVFAAKLRAAFSESSAPGSKPRFLCADDEATGTESRVTAEGETITVFTDTRTREQRQIDVLEGLITAGLRSADLGGGMRSTATVTVVIPIDEFETGNGVGYIDGIEEPISAATVQRLVCDAGYRHVVLGPSGEVLHFGHTKRFFTPKQKQALGHRDGGCVINGCTAPPDWCDAHHVKEVVAHQGKTDIDNGVLLCGEHHTWIHNSDYQLRMIRGMPHLLAPLAVDPTQTWLPVGKSRFELLRALRRTG